MRGGLILMSVMLLTQPYGVGFAADSLPGAAGAVTTQSVCDELLAQAQQVDRLLRSVSDRESADKAAEALRGVLGNMQQLCRQLEMMPVETHEAARELAASMRSLTHVFQGYMPVVERLMEVNAYGSDKLINVFHLFKVHEGYRTENHRRESPRLISYQEWTDALEYLLYHVRKLRSADELAECRPQIEEAVRRVELCRNAAESAAENGDEDALSEMRRQLETLRGELRDEQTRLSAAGLLSGELAELLNRCY